nr:hypothetical protein GCM10020092_019240 [Actinoplanes digitatis]
MFMVIKYAGAAYLAWVGFGIIRSGWRKLRNRGAEPAARAASGPTGEITGPAGVATNGMAANSPARHGSERSGRHGE